ncbi:MULTISPECIES: hypothetical protein [unclassified Acinetobacter]|uniref:hypothetical protein n=1 Tax=unclassified Acinetobacter TaxID=196816 RepID=UPI00293458C8|nr:MULTISPECIES: hypothetical protein [unclassified Acinetobacter]WOE31740.1 hypothetical protein QSG84_00465 [Acinetobacter sp. SAAs470]WOE37207.1 hypothetical protein QSG86_09510 [Acinetobacter sp. SAAs474]
MQQNYQLNLYQHGKLLGHFQTTSLHPLDDLKIIFNRLQSYHDFSFELYQCIENKRFLMQHQDKIQLLGTEVIYQSCALAQLMEANT